LGASWGRKKQKLRATSLVQNFAGNKSRKVQTEWQLAFCSNSKAGKTGQIEFRFLLPVSRKKSCKALAILGEHFQMQKPDVFERLERNWKNSAAVGGV
jgi:hypothetical protein